MASAQTELCLGICCPWLEAGDLKKDTPETEPRVLSLLCHLQNEESLDGLFDFPGTSLRVNL